MSRSLVLMLSIASHLLSRGCPLRPPCATGYLRHTPTTGMVTVVTKVNK